MRAHGDEPGDGLLGDGLIAWLSPAWFDAKFAVEKSTRIDIGIAYTSLFQKATDSVNGPDRAASGDFDLYGKWHLVGDGTGNSGFLGFAFEDRHAYGAIPPSELGDSIGSLWPTTRAFDEHPFGLNQIYWDQHLADGRAHFRAGAYDRKTIFDQYTFRSETNYFQNQMFSGNSTYTPPGGGFGGFASWNPSDSTYILAGIADANGTRVSPSLDSFFNVREYFTSAEFGYSPQFGPYEAAYFRATVWHVDAREQAGTAPGTGLALTAEHQRDDLILFLRYAHADADASTVFAGQNVNTGFGIMQPFGRADDVFAFGLGGGEEVNGTRWQVATETFYRVQLTAFVHLTASIQGIFNPISNPDKNALAVFGLRLRLVL